MGSLPQNSNDTMTQDFVSTIGEFERETVISNALGALGENDQLRVETVENIRQWIAQQPTLARVQLDDYIILAYARGCKYSIKKIQQRLATTLTMRATIPEFFHDWDPSKPELQAALGEGSFLPLLNYDNLGRKVIIIRPGCYDPYLHKLEDIEKSNFMSFNSQASQCYQKMVALFTKCCSIESKESAFYSNVSFLPHGFQFDE